jgi:hypothetical protein
MTTWTIEKVAARFEEAANTIARLPAVRMQGFFNCWPTIKRQRWERLCVDDKLHRFPPDPRALDRLDETLAWLIWLDVEQRHLVWMRAEDEPWRDICARLGCDRTTAWRRWQRALASLVSRLNDLQARKPCELGST